MCNERRVSAVQRFLLSLFLGMAMLATSDLGLAGTSQSGPLALGKKLPTAAPSIETRGSADFEAMVHCRMILADHEWEQRIWPDTNPEPKPPRRQLVPDAEIRRQVDDVLRMERALGALYGVELEKTSTDTLRINAPQKADKTAVQTSIPLIVIGGMVLKTQRTQESGCSCIAILFAFR